MFKECVDNGCSFALRDNPIARLWERAIKADPELKQRYTPLKTRDAKAKMREEWAKEKYEILSKGRSWEKSWQKIDISRGKYINFGLLVESFGIHYDRPSAVIAATKHADKCLKMTGDWIRYDKMGEVMEENRAESNLEQTHCPRKTLHQLMR